VIILTNLVLKRTTLQVWAVVLKSVADYYRSNGSYVFTTFLDLLKAFDINFFLWNWSNVIKLLAYWYAHQLLTVRWKNVVTQGSVLGPILFMIYVSPIASIVSSHGVNQQQYSDDTQLFVVLSPLSLSSSLCNLQRCVSSLHSWFIHNGLVLNTTKTEAICFGTSPRLQSFSHLTSIEVIAGRPTSVSLVDYVRLLGVTFDKHLNFDKHISNICSSSYYHIRAPHHIRSFLDSETSKIIACATVGSRLDYVNSVLTGISSRNIHRLQRVQNSLARVVTCSTIPTPPQL